MPPTNIFSRPAPVFWIDGLQETVGELCTVEGTNTLKNKKTATLV